MFEFFIEPVAPFFHNVFLGVLFVFQEIAVFILAAKSYFHPTAFLLLLQLLQHSFELHLEIQVHLDYLIEFIDIEQN